MILRHRTPLTIQAIPWILVISALPVFYKMTISQDLYAAVEGPGIQQPQRSSVNLYPVFNDLLINHAMSDLEVRGRVVQYYALF